MNDNRRKEIKAVLSRVSSLNRRLQELQEEIARIRDEEQEYLDNMPENMQDGDKGVKAQEAIDQLDEAVNFFDDKSEMDEGEDYLRNAMA